jgi:hypothetical protein
MNTAIERARHTWPNWSRRSAASVVTTRRFVQRAPWSTVSRWIGRRLFLWERMRLTRKRNRERWELLESVVESLTVNNRETREKFEAQCQSRWVVVLADAGEKVEDFAGRVTSFHPHDMVSVVDMSGHFHAVPLRKVSEDLGRKFYPGHLQSPDADPSEKAEGFAGMVVGFHPGDMLSVVDAAGYTHAVPLCKIAGDRGRKLSLNHPAA